jgi:hypothetical protein|tara:strand:- start:9600 stop:11930 length:2331 start_codon:yes stop_codon:yes gene_type:complete
MLLTAMLLLAVTVVPGYALCKVLDGSADRLRKALLSPALGLLLAYGIAGALVYTNLWTWGLMSACLLLLNAYAVLRLQRRADETKSLTPWQALEAAMHGEITSTEESVLSEEVTAQRWFQSHRKPWIVALGGFVAFSCLSLPFMQTLPFGVDWIGFSMLSGQIHATGTMMLPGTNEGFWTYPPAFPSLAAWLQGALGLTSGQAVFHLGHYSLFALVLGIGGAMDRHGAGAHGMLAMALGAGLFAKTFDSGYPTVASQLGLVVGLLVLLRPTSTRGKHHTRGFVLAFLCVAFIHPTGAIYLGMLMAAHLVIGFRLDEKHGANVQKLLMVSAGLLTAAAAIALLVLAPRMLDAAVFAEYGWQGGRPLATYNLILLVGGLLAAWRLRGSVEGMLLATWFGGLWLLSGIHLIEGLEQIPILSLLSYVLYSMGLHAFHVPLAALFALLWSDTTNLTSVTKQKGFMGVGWDPHLHRHIVTGLLVSVMVGIIIGNLLLVQVSQHDELRPMSNGDFELMADVENLPSGSIVFSENAQWGYVLDAPSHVQFTSLPTLGLVQLETTIQAEATSAVFGDLPLAIKALNITHAVSSPLGTAGWFLGASAYWSIVAEHSGSVLWVFDSTGSSDPYEYASANERSCVNGCTMRDDPWREHRFRDPLDLGDQRPFIEEGRTSTLNYALTSNLQQNRTVCLVYEAVGNLGDFSITINAQQTTSADILHARAGWHSTCLQVAELTSSDLTLTIDWEDGPNSGSRWINPTGFSGRGDALFDRTGLRMHWLELRD